jgi:hypothetical protein
VLDIYQCRRADSLRSDHLISNLIFQPATCNLQPAAASSQLFSSLDWVPTSGLRSLVKSAERRIP